MKKVLSFALAVVLSFSLLIGSAFASSGAAVIVAPDTFISWGDSNDSYTLSAPYVALNNRNYIVYQVRDWALNYLRVRFVIDSFDADVVPVEGQVVDGWIRYSGTWAFGVNAALEPTYYNTSLYADENYTYSRSFLHKPVYSNFDYYDADGQLIISGDTSGSADDTLMDLTLIDGTVIQVPRSLQGLDFVVARSSSVDQYRIWLFQPSQVESGLVYEGSTEAMYFTSDGAFSHGLDISPLPSLSWDTESYPYFLIYYRSDPQAGGAIVFSEIPPVYFTTTSYDDVSYSQLKGYATASFDGLRYSFSSGDWSTEPSSFHLDSGQTFVRYFTVLFHDFDLLDNDGNVLFLKNSSLVASGFEWQPWLTMSTALDIMQYGDIVYQSFNYPTSAPEESPSPSPNPDDVPDSSNNGLFPWLREQWVFLMGRLTGVIDAINALADKLDPFPDQTTPILNNFFDVVFPNRITDTDINNIDIVLDRFSGWFNTGYTFSDFFNLFDQDYFLNWFTDDTKNALDTVGGAE